MIQFPYRPDGPFFCDIQGKFKATFTDPKGKEKRCSIYIFGFRSGGIGPKNRENATCFYHLYKKDGSLEKKIHEVTYKDLLPIIGCILPKPIVKEEVDK